MAQPVKKFIHLFFEFDHPLLAVKRQLAETLQSRMLQEFLPVLQRRPSSRFNF